MRTISKLVAIATVSASLGFHVNPAAAQGFEDRWSIVPKAHADPAPAPPDQTKQEPRAQPPSSDTPIQNSESSNTRPRVFSGKASFYSYRTGKTASGSSFDRDLQTAAHRSLPFGTNVRVTVPATNKSMVVRITDRGPNIRGRVLDLSLGAARNLGIRDSALACWQERRAMRGARKSALLPKIIGICRNFRQVTTTVVGSFASVAVRRSLPVCLGTQ